MRNKIKSILKWFLHEHEFEIEYRLITLKQELYDNKWTEKDWIKIIWYKKCKTCGIKENQTFNK